MSKYTDIQCVPIDYYTAITVIVKELQDKLSELREASSCQATDSGIDGIIKAHQYLLDQAQAERGRLHALFADALPRID